MSVWGEKLGSKCLITIKQGILFKKSHGLNKMWKQYVPLFDDEHLTYHPSLLVNIPCPNVINKGENMAIIPD